MAPRFVIVEDDHLQKGPLEDRLKLTFAGAEVTTLSSEYQFREHLTTMRESPPDLVLLDVMLRWTLPAPNAPAPPPEVAEGGYYRAGLRCANLLQADEQLRKVPVVLYTILERSDLERDNKALPANSSYVGKSGDVEVLLRKVRDLIS
jgi:CheY-like chemotaxis protein